MSLTPLERELLGYVKQLSEVCEQSVNTSEENTQFLIELLKLLMGSQSEVFNALDALAREEIEFERLTTSLSKVGGALITAERRLKKLSKG